MTRTDDDAPAFAVLAGNPTAAELAAVTAVITAMAEEVGNQRMPAAQARPGAWERSARRLRREIVPGPGAWNSEKF